MTSGEYHLGPPAPDRDSYDVTVEWDSEHQLVFLKDWDPYDARYLTFQPLTPQQMDNLLAWWQREKAHLLFFVWATSEALAQAEQPNETPGNRE